MNTPDFSDLSEFIDDWGLNTSAERLNKRSSTDMSELREFHDAITPRLEEIIQFLNQFPVNDIPEKYKHLSWLALAICEVDDAINLWKASNLDYISDPNSWRTKSSYCDYQ
jgi:hypothetical protein